jgi:hypothetical protein
VLQPGRNDQAKIPLTEVPGRFWGGTSLSDAVGLLLAAGWGAFPGSNLEYGLNQPGHLWGIFTSSVVGPTTEEALGEAFYRVLVNTGPVTLSPKQAYALADMGLVELMGHQVKLRCELYRAYFCPLLELECG